MHPIGTQTLLTERLLLRRHQPEDAVGIFRNWASDPEVARFWSWEAHRTPADTRAILAQWIAAYRDPGYFHWAIIHKATRQPIGAIFLDEWDPADNSAAVHFLLAREFWNQGLATEALQAVVAHAFDAIGLNALFSRHHSLNPASGRVLRKCGFSHSHSAYRTLTPERISGTYHFYRIEKR